MKVFKFGGASVRNAAGIKNVALILQKHAAGKLVVVVSAMGQTTNTLERVLQLQQSGKDYRSELDLLKEYHWQIQDELFEKDHEVFDAVGKRWRDLENKLQGAHPFDMLYDQVLCFGELVSTVIVYNYLSTTQLSAAWIDARDFIATDNTFREGKVDWVKTRKNIRQVRDIFKTKNIVVTQGFIGRTKDGFTTTLGRDGSDFTAAIFGSCLDVESVTIWKDVPGVMNADPKRMEAVRVFDELPFREAAEMTYYGASVIHPKTIKPIATKNIPLYVKSFDDPSLPGTRIHETHLEHIPPLIVFKDNQCLISCKVTDYTFITEEHLGKIFHALAELNIHITLMQNSAISFSFCIDFRENRLMALITKLRESFEVYYNTGLTLITVKNYDENTFDTFRKRKGVLLEQSSRSTLQVLVRQP